MTLTEQWKKGELKEGWYYVLCEDEMVMLEWEGDYFLSGDVPLTGDGDVYIKEVLAPVPSYEEWQKVLNIDFNNEVLRLENAKLKELLKESAAYVKSVVVVANDCKEYEVAKKHNKLFMDICEAIGEKK